MKQGKSLQELAVELDRQQSQKRDFIADTRSIVMTVNDETKKPSLALHNEGGLIDELSINGNTHRQMAQRIGIPQKYYDRMLVEAPELLANNLNHWFDKKPEKRLIRTLDGAARAFLSNRYRCLDNYDLAQAVLPVLGEAGEIQIHSTEVTESRLYIKAIFPRIEAEVKVGDVVQSGIVISNSEIGYGSLKVEPLLYRLVCMNGMISASTMKQNHVGRGSDIDELTAMELLRDETLQATDKAFWMKVQDVVRAAVTDSGFAGIIEAVKKAAGETIDIKPVEVVERTASHFQITEGEKDDILTHLIQGNDFSKWGLCNAVTRASQDVESYDRATELERLGGQIIELPSTDWKTLAQAA